MTAIFKWMAQAGWYCTSVDPKDPSAKCPFCLKELSGWERIDDPWNEHQKHSANCKFVLLNKKESEYTVEDVFALLEARMLTVLEKQYKENLKKLEEARDTVILELNKLEE